MNAISFQKAYMLRMASSTTIPYMNKTICNSVPVLLPPLKMQSKFSDIFIEAHKGLEKFACFKDLASDLFEALTQKAFRGELTESKAA